MLDELTDLTTTIKPIRVPADFSINALNPYG